MPDTVELRANMPRIKEAVLFLVHEAARLGVPATQYDIVKSLFLADKEHLNKYGRPVTFDNYVAMKHGPVPSKTYDLLKGKPSVVRDAGGAVPWERREAPELGNSCNSFESPLREVDEDILSPSDMKALASAFGKVKKLGFGEVRTLTHGHPAYKEAWRDDPYFRAFPMDYSRLFDRPDPDKAAEIAFFSQHI